METERERWGRKGGREDGDGERAREVERIGATVKLLGEQL